MPSFSHMHNVVFCHDAAQLLIFVLICVVHKTFRANKTAG